MDISHYISMVNQKQPFVDVLQGKYSPVPFEIFTEKTFSLFCLL